MKRTPDITSVEKEQYWTKVIQEAQENPGGVTAYCKDKAISKTNFYVWYNRLRSQAKKRKRPNVGKNVQSQPETEVSEKASRRKYRAEDKARILKETDVASKGEVAAILRREGIYASHLQKWRLERDLVALAPKKRGRKGNPLAGEVRKLKKQNERLEKRLDQANKIIDLQKKVSEILGVTLKPTDEEE